MKMLDRYIARQFLVTLLFASASFLFLFVLINLVENLDEFIDRQVPVWRIVLFYLSGLPETFLLTTPLSVLLASLFVTGKLSMQSELPAMKSAGISLGRLMRPFLAVALVVTGVNILNACMIVPSTYDWSKGFEKNYLKNRRDSAEGSVRIRESKNRILSVGTIGSDRQSALSVSLEEFDGPRLLTRIDADSLRIRGNRWVFYNAKKRSFSNAGERMTATPVESLQLSLSDNTFRMIGADPDQMTVDRHYRYIREQEKAGFSGLEKAKVKLHAKIAMPFASIIIVLIGVPLSTRKKRSGLALEAGISLLVGFLFLGLQKTFSSVGYNGIIAPALAAWLPNLLFLAAGALLYRSANE